MPLRSPHLATAAVNARLAADLDSPASSGREWVPTVLFYGIVHLIEAALALQSVHPLGHRARALAIEESWGESAADLFENVRDLSEQWRYSGRAPSGDELAAAKQWVGQLVGIVDESWPVPGYLDS